MRNFLIHMGFAVVVSLILFIFTPVLAILYFLFHLTWMFFDDRKTVGAQNTETNLKAKYPPVPTPDLELVTKHSAVTLKADFVKDALIRTVAHVDYAAGNKQHRSMVENFFQSVMSGKYTAKLLTVSQKLYTPGSDDGPEEYEIICCDFSFNVTGSAFRCCNIGDNIAVISVSGFPYIAAAIRLDPIEQAHKTIWLEEFYRFREGSSGLKRV